MNNTRVFFDLDGTLAKWNHVDEKQLYQEGYFKNLKPHYKILDMAKTLINLDIEVLILSSYLEDSKYCAKEKIEWISTYLPEIPKNHILLVPYGTQKADFILNQYHAALTTNDVLIDDYTVNLNDWKEHNGTAIKFLNGLNHTNGSWQGACLNNDTESISFIISELCKRDKEMEALAAVGMELNK